MTELGTPETIPTTRTPLLASLTNAHEKSISGQPSPDWTRYQEYLGYLKQHPEEIATSIQSAPRRSGSNHIDNLLAAIASKLADDARQPRPDWTHNVTPLAYAWFPEGTHDKLQHEMRTTPAQFSERGIWLGEENLWRRD